MKRAYLVLLLFMLTAALFGQDFQKVKEGMAKADVLKMLGNPTKKLLSDDKTAECYLWFKKDTVWLLFFKANKTSGTASTIEDLAKGLLNLASAFSDLGQTESPAVSPAPDSTSKTAIAAPQDEAIKAQIEIETLDAKIFETWNNERKAGCRFKIKNNSSQTIYELDLTVYYYDQNGNAFFEQVLYPVSSSSITDRVILKPNYSILYPAGENQFMTADGMDLAEWDEGKIRVEITKVVTQRP